MYRPGMIRGEVDGECGHRGIRNAEPAEVRLQIVRAEATSKFNNSNRLTGTVPLRKAIQVGNGHR